MFEDLKHTLQNSEFAPPPGVWKNISASLAESKPFDQLNARLHEFTVLPPASAWETVRAQLQEELPPSLPHRYSKQKTVFRFLAAATVTGLLVMGGLYFFNRSSEKKQQVSLLPATTKDSETSSTPQPEETPEYARTPVASSAGMAGSPAPLRVKKNDRNESTRLLRNTIVRLTGFPITPSEIMVAARPIRNEKGDIIQDAKVLAYPNARYIKVTSPNGQQTYISSKFKNFLLYLNQDNDVSEREGYFDKAFIESLVWQSKFTRWRNTILQNAIIPSSTNFMDIMELKDLILTDKENR